MNAPLDAFELSLLEEQATGQAILKLLEAYRAGQRVPPAEERQAWDRFSAAELARTGNAASAAGAADKAIGFRRDRFGAPR